MISVLQAARDIIKGDDLMPDRCLSPTPLYRSHHAHRLLCTMLIIYVPEAISNIHSRDPVTTICHTVLFIVHTTPTDFLLCIMLMISVASSDIHSGDLVATTCQSFHPLHRSHNALRLPYIHHIMVDFCDVIHNGDLAITVCHSTPFIVDTTPPD